MLELNRFQIAAVKRTHAITKPLRTKLNKLNAKIDALKQEEEEIKNQISMWEAPIIEMSRGYSSDQILSGDAEKEINEVAVSDSVNTEEVQPTFNAVEQFENDMPFSI